MRKRKSIKFLSKIILVDDNNVATRVLDYHEIWEQRIASHRKIVIIGLGYVGLTMAAVIADCGFNVIGYDQDKLKVDKLLRGKNYIHEKGLTELINKNINKSLFVSKSIPEDGDVYIISVGTPINSEINNFQPDMSFLESACEETARVLKRGNLVILRSTVPIGTTSNFVKKILEDNSKLKCGIDFHLSFAPERTAEGQAMTELRELPQIIGGYNKDSLEATAALFRDVTNTIVRVDSLEAAEMVKLINNSFRDYIFAYSNQISKIGHKFNLDVVEIIKAANKGYKRDPVPLPSPGVGGPCLTKDPYIFASSSDNYNNNSIFLRSREINESMHSFVIDNVISTLKSIKKNVKNTKILICGLAFKGNPETGDLRNSSGVEIAMKLTKLGYKIFCYDSVANSGDIQSIGLRPETIPVGFKNKDVVIFLNNHKSFEKIDIRKMVLSMNYKPIIFDGWHMFRHSDIISVKESIYMGLSYSKSSIKK